MRYATDYSVPYYLLVGRFNECRAFKGKYMEDRLLYSAAESSTEYLIYSVLQRAMRRWSSSNVLRFRTPYLRRRNRRPEKNIREISTRRRSFRGRVRPLTRRSVARRVASRHITSKGDHVPFLGDVQTRSGMYTSRRKKVREARDATDRQWSVAVTSARARRRDARPTRHVGRPRRPEIIGFNPHGERKKSGGSVSLRSDAPPWRVTFRLYGARDSRISTGGSDRCVYARQKTIINLLA